MLIIERLRISSILHAVFLVKDAAVYSFPIIGNMNSPIGAILDTFPGYFVGSLIGRFKYSWGIYLAWNYMDSITKFDGTDYANTFAKKINVMHELVKSVLSGHLKEGDDIIDLGGGPGMGARILEELGIKATLINIEPSTTIYDVPRLSLVKYIPLKMTFKEALDAQMPCIASCLLMVSSEHEIALCNGGIANENKKIFLGDLNKFIHKNLKKNGSLVFGFPNYRKGASKTAINRQRILTESILGHSHPPEELFTVDEFSEAFGARPDVFIQKPMNLANEDPEETILMANVVVFNMKNL